MGPRCSLLVGSPNKGRTAPGHGHIPAAAPYTPVSANRPVSVPLTRWVTSSGAKWTGVRRGYRGGRPTDEELGIGEVSEEDNWIASHSFLPGDVGAGSAYSRGFPRKAAFLPTGSGHNYVWGVGGHSWTCAELRAKGCSVNHEYLIAGDRRTARESWTWAGSADAVPGLTLATAPSSALLTTYVSPYTEPEPGVLKPVVGSGVDEADPVPGP